MPQTPAQIQAAAQARALGSSSGEVQAQALQSPAVRRSRYLAELLERTQQAPQEIRSGGELGARLLAQGIAQWGKGRADKAVATETADRTRSQGEAASAALARLLGGQPTPITPQAPPPSIAPEGPGNTLTPVQSPTAPVAPIQGAELPPVGQMPAPAPQAPPQAAPQQASNPLAPTQGEAAIIQRLLASNDPAQIAEAQAQIASIEQRMAAPSEWKDVSVNGVPFLRDQAGRSRALFEGGIPDQAMTQDEFNPAGTRAGTLGQRSPTGALQIVERPPEGFESAGGRLQPVAGGPQDQTTGGNQITNERNLRQEYDKATQDYREAQAGFRKVQAAANDDSGASDIALIFGFMKTLDPGSTVREGEFATAQNTGSVPQQVVAAYNKAISGERLLPEQRQMFARTAADQFQTYEQSYQNRVGQFIGMAENYGLNPTNVVGPQTAPQRQSPRAAAPAGNNGNVLRQRFTPEQARAERARRLAQGSR